MQYYSIKQGNIQVKNSICILQCNYINKLTAKGDWIMRVYASNLCKFLSTQNNLASLYINIKKTKVLGFVSQAS